MVNAAAGVLEAIAVVLLVANVTVPLMVAQLCAHASVPILTQLLLLFLAML
jgi:hypothetical protein